MDQAAFEAVAAEVGFEDFGACAASELRVRADVRNMCAAGRCGSLDLATVKAGTVLWDLDLATVKTGIVLCNLDVAYEAATADLQDVNMIDPFHLEAYGVTTVNYNRDVEIYPVLAAIFEGIYGYCPYKSPTVWALSRCAILRSMPSNAPPHIKRMLRVSTCI